MTEEAYVSFEVAKLLKEKGFNGFCERFYDYYPETGEVHICGCDEHDNSRYDDEFSMPTQQMAIRWLREEHKMYVCIDIKCFMPHLGEIDGYSSCIWYKPDNNEGICCYWTYPPKQQEAWDTYETATEAAIKYCLENLIKED